VPPSGKTLPLRSSGAPLHAIRVEVIQGPDRGLSFLAKSDRVTIGTAPGNDVILSDDTVSRYHLELVRTGDRVRVEDHGSTNGTAVGAVRIERAAISTGTHLLLGRTTILVDEGGETVPVELSGHDRFGRCYGRAPEMRRMAATLEKAAPTDVSILLLGETGSGKEVVAQSIHEASRRADQPFETVDCGALLPTLVASELFGHERGAFTGADRRFVGAFERAHGGTLFLDEIGELPLSLQPALLGVLERRKIRRLGGDKPIPVDVRLICATHRDLRSEVNAGTFRQDLYYRIAVLLVRVPPLRERLGDIPQLVERFLEEAGYKGAIGDVISPAVLKTLKDHRWPGNVRELRNFVDTALAIGEAPHLTAEGREAGAHAVRDGSGGIVVPADGSFDSSIELLQRALIGRALEQAAGNIAKAAESLGMERSRLSKIVRRLRIRVDDGD
jgi:transcriptional regulator with GAF, ATPase, and Fis domain